METRHEASITSSSWAVSLAGIALFILWDIALVSGVIPTHWSSVSWSGPVANSVLAALALFPLVALIIGWFKGFPRWSYPYVVHAFFFSLYMTKINTPDIRLFGYSLFGYDAWGWRAFIPLSIVLLILVALSRSVSPFKKFFANIWNDWTLLTFGMFGILPLIVGIGFDEIDRRYSLSFMVILGLQITVAAFLYMRGSSKWSRTKIMLASTLITLTITIIGTNLYWQQHSPVALSSCATEGAMITLIMFSPAVLGLANRGRMVESIA